MRTFLFAIMLNLGFAYTTKVFSQGVSVKESTQNPGIVQVYNYPRFCPKNNDFKLKADGEEIFVYNTSAAPFAAFSCSGEINIEVSLPQRTGSISISPKKYGIDPVVSGNNASFKIPGPMLIVLEYDGMPALFIYANPLEKNMPEISASNVLYFKAGQVYEVGELRLSDNQTLYIEGGAVVRGCVRATAAKNVRIGGFGILDGGYYNKSDPRRSIIFEDCQNSVIEDITVVEPSSWIIVLGICRNITVRNIKELGSVGSTDGTDIVGSKEILVENCFFRNGDDCIAIKSLDLRSHESATLDFSSNVKDVEIKGCSFLSYIGGQALEIGHELRTDSITNIRFIDCDILGVHGFGGVFGIHNSDHATVSNVLYENIRVEHHYDKLIDIRIIKSRWSVDSERGQIQNIIFRNIDVAISEYNPGYSMSVIGGYDNGHLVQNVLFENIKLNGKKIGSADELDLYCKQVKNVFFK
jgi:hypothetical protein